MEKKRTVADREVEQGTVHAGLATPYPSVKDLPATQHTQRIADPAWENPLDPGFAGRRGGRWNPPDSFPVVVGQIIPSEPFRSLSH